MNDKNMKTLVKIAIGLLIVIALGIAGNGDIEEAEVQAKVYTDMVCKGNWPDYENRKPKCN